MIDSALPKPDARVGRGRTDAVQPSPPKLAREDLCHAGFRRALRQSAAPLAGTRTAPTHASRSNFLTQHSYLSITSPCAGSSFTVKCRNAGGCSTIFIPRIFARRSFTYSNTSAR